MDSKKKTSRKSKLLALLAIFAFIFSFLGPEVLGNPLPSSSSQTCTVYPCTSSIKVISYDGDDASAVSGLINNQIAAYDNQLTPADLASLPSGLDQVTAPNSLYEVLVNPENTTWAAVAGFTGAQLNPFYFPQIRTALNYVLNRNYFVDAILGGSGVPTLSIYGVSPDSLTVANTTVKYSDYFGSNFDLANSTIYNAMSSVQGVSVVGGKYNFGSNPVTIYVAERTDNSFINQYDNFLATQLTNLGFTTVLEPTNPALAKSTVDSENPVNGSGGAPPTPWDIYVNSLGNEFTYYGDSLEACSAGANCAAGPYSDNLTGVAAFCEPNCAEGLYNTVNATPPDVIALSDQLDVLNAKILNGSYSAPAERDQILNNYTAHEIEMGVNDWIAAGLSPYAYNPSLIQNLVPLYTSSPILNFQSLLTMQPTIGQTTLNIGASYLTQENINPIGLALGQDPYSADLLSGVFPTLSVPSPGTGYLWPNGFAYAINGMSSSNSLPVPSSAVNYNSTTGLWQNITGDTASIDFVANFADMAYHSGFADNETWNLADILYPYTIAMNITNPGAKPSIYDGAAGPLFSSVLPEIAGVRVLNSTAIEVYSKYYFTDPVLDVLTSLGFLYGGYTRDYSLPWTVYVAMSDLVGRGLDSWTQTGSISKGIPWLSLIGSGANGEALTNLTNDLVARAAQGSLPNQISQLEHLTGVTIANSSTVGSSFTDAANFIRAYGNALIGDGPFYVSDFSSSTSPSFAILTANANYNLAPYLNPNIFSPSATRISISGTVLPTVTVGSSLSFVALATPLDGKIASPESGADLVVQLLNGATIVNQVSLVTGSGGAANYNIPSVPLGAYTLIVYASSPNSTFVDPQSYATSIVAPSPGTSLTTAASTSTARSSSTTSISSQPVVPSVPGPGTLEVIAIIVLVVILIAAAVLFFRRTIEDRKAKE